MIVHPAWFVGCGVDLRWSYPRVVVLLSYCSLAGADLYAASYDWRFAPDKLEAMGEALTMTRVKLR
jgi:hypothetical protein